MGLRALTFAALAAAFALAAPGPGRAQEEPVQEEAAQTPAPAMSIYADRLTSGWDNWSWAQVILGVASTDGERPIQVNAGAWQALYVHHAPFSTERYSTFSFWINGGPSGGQSIAVAALDEAGEIIADRALVLTLRANEWVHVEAPLSRLGAANRVVSGFWIQNGTPNQAPVFFVNGIALN